MNTNEAVKYLKMITDSFDHSTAPRFDREKIEAERNKARQAIALAIAMLEGGKMLPEPKAKVSGWECGRIPSNTDIHEGVMFGHITAEEGNLLSANYLPNEKALNKKGEPLPTGKKNWHIYTSMVKERKKRLALDKN